MYRFQLSSAATTTVPANAVVLVPVGSIEQHGPHLPLDTDTVIATSVATGAAQRLRDAGHTVMVAPAVCYGASGEHQSFAGTSSIGINVLRHVLIELGRSMSNWADQVVFINAHGGNVGSVGPAVDQLTEEGHTVSWMPCRTEAFDLHAGRTETSLMLHLKPWDVRIEHAAVGNTGTLHELMPLMRSGGVRAVSPNGVLGDPAGATAEEGHAILNGMVDEISRALIRSLDKTGAS
ncbi:mycofactocin biosynthesis peptidyl-dipeptidase MftE [Nocardioides cavernae]|uniref:Mycofactocin biosynthesis peptidyl-dipeptidase MftE n=1 Tax=Nocardioides cavernae TaxID=1921566 RepID=A0ABR8N7S3_9ACTN|nr:mycofactocin biosynthesis peptidyl-dipeptidase MftE [Nocardioides cavernae]MBD3924200.1 mycofactocin biosynthesis peptidyl-dipeptidase MftE [Nocardioides cavernae]MBM7510862.1 creatinine amidohydrolase [Nocardioides cavernae]